MSDRTGWTQRRLQSTEAYLRHTVREGRRDVYDAEEHRLLWLDVKAEIDRRKAAGEWKKQEPGMGEPT